MPFWSSEENGDRTAADVLIETIIDWGVDVVFGLPGDGINGIMESLRKRQEEIRFVQVRHEEAAAFMACAYAKYTGKLGVCLATSGPGGLHLLGRVRRRAVPAVRGLVRGGLHQRHRRRRRRRDRLRR